MKYKIFKEDVNYIDFVVNKKEAKLDWNKIKVVKK